MVAWCEAEVAVGNEGVDNGMWCWQALVTSRWECSGDSCAHDL